MEPPSVFVMSWRRGRVITHRRGAAKAGASVGSFRLVINPGHRARWARGIAWHREGQPVRPRPAQRHHPSGRAWNRSGRPPRAMTLVVRAGAEIQPAAVLAVNDGEPAIGALARGGHGAFSVRIVYSRSLAADHLPHQRRTTSVAPGLWPLALARRPPESGEVAMVDRRVCIAITFPDARPPQRCAGPNADSTCPRADGGGDVAACAGATIVALRGTAADGRSCRVDRAADARCPFACVVRFVPAPWD
jgi:hypothetical protein